MAGLLGLDPSEMTQMLGSGKTEEEVIGEHLKDAGDDRKHTSSSTTEKQKSRVVNAERLYAEMWSSTDPKKPLERRIKKALFSIGFVKEKK
jgi:prophage antirepressor-like protein